MHLLKLNSFLFCLSILILFAISLQIAFTDSTLGDIAKQANINQETYQDSCQESQNKKEEEIVDESQFKITRIDPVEVNYTRNIHLYEGQVHKMITRSIKPPVFTVENFLSNEECDYIIEKVKKSGRLAPSLLKMDDKTLLNKEYTKSIYSYGYNFEFWDLNRNEHIEYPEEIKSIAEAHYLLYLEDDEILDIITKFNIKLDVDNKGKKYISKNSFKHINGAGLMQYLRNLREYGLRHRDRASNQVWLSQDYDDRLKEIWRKAKILTKLPDTVVDGGEFLQVVHYGLHGHYYAHYDSNDKADNPGQKCCHISNDEEKCRICRYLTILYFLNDVEEGGDTAFPVADVPNFNKTEFEQRKDGDMYNLSKNCYKAKLYLKPKKGMAVLWYNHLMNDDNTLGPLDPYSLHGGCDVIKGEKWIANNWIPANEADSLTQVSRYTPLPNMKTD